VPLRFVQGLGASDSATIDIGLAQSVEGQNAERNARLAAAAATESGVGW
jgi:hypothetical protein